MPAKLFQRYHHNNLFYKKNLYSSAFGCIELQAYNLNSPNLSLDGVYTNSYFFGVPT
jgi:hypothetical protein